MTDDTRPADDAERDERLAAFLKVPPLDDVTRKRLVRRALDESGGESQRPGHRSRLLAVAAAVLAVLVIGGGTALVLRDDGDDSTVASRTEDARGAAEADSADAPAPTYVGDLGEISDPAVLRERLVTAPKSTLPGAGETESVLSDRPVCDADLLPLNLDSPLEIGTGTFEGTPVIVVVGARDDQRLAVVLAPPDCGLLAEVPI